MESLFKELMNRGFLIFEEDAKFVLLKVATPADPRTAITDEVVPNTSRLEFATYCAAMDKAQLLIDWSEKQTTGTQLHDTIWVMQMMYQLPSGPKFVELGEMGTVPHDVAVKEAKERADRYIEESLSEEDISGYDVRVRPTRKI
tara:strand:- start:135 stop:566 length:432 start_codon:yes stop_codon:yes gene_type:complete